MHIEETFLPKELLSRSSLIGSEYAWLPEDVERVIRMAEAHNIAAIGGQAQFRLPGATCELYWVNFDAESRRPEEPWPQHVGRCAQESIDRYRILLERVDIIGEGVKAFKVLEAQQTKEDLSRYLCFTLYFVSEHERRGDI